MQRRSIILISLLLWHAAASSAEPVAEATPSTRENDAKQMLVLNAGAQVLKNGHPIEAIDNYFDKVIAAYETTYPADGGTHIYCARNSTETLAYMLQAAKAQQNAIAIGPTWCDAYYLRGYALIELGRYTQARAALEKAIAMAPDSAHYLSELAGLHAREKNWPDALATFERAAQAARDFSTPESKDRVLGVALRGKGYVLTEMGRLDDAQAVYQQCLELNADDKAARAELQYVQSRRAQAKLP